MPVFTPLVFTPFFRFAELLNKESIMKHSYIMVFGFAVAIQSGFATAQQGNCDAVLDLGINAQEDFSKVTINETYYKMLSMT